VNNFLRQNEIVKENVRILRPEREYVTPLNVVNIDTAPLAYDDTGLLRPDRAADMMYTYDQKKVLAVRPADCPIVCVSAETPKGPVTILLHLAWMGVAHGYIQQAKNELDAVDIDWSSAQVQITPGGHAETYTFREFKSFDPAGAFPDAATMFIDVKEHTDDEGKVSYSFGIDVAAEVYEQIASSWGIDSRNIFADTSNTTAPESGYASHSRSFKKYAVDGDNVRDLVVARRR
jgi:copper oxidase (laccase) domain-containing protein